MRRAGDAALHSGPLGALLLAGPCCCSLAPTTSRWPWLSEARAQQRWEEQSRLAAAPRAERCVGRLTARRLQLDEPGFQALCDSSGRLVLLAALVLHGGQRQRRVNVNGSASEQQQGQGVVEGSSALLASAAKSATER